jgi:uncharacterized protein (DUF4415 family)
MVTRNRKREEDKEEDIVRFVTSLDDGTYIVEHVADGRLERIKNETDWERVRSMTEEEIEANARSDPEWDGDLDVDWSKAVLVMPKRKEAISIRLDDDVLAFFKSLGSGYQTRINAVLRHFMEQTKAKRK